MSGASIGSQILSKLGSPDSRIPLAAKDIFNSAGYTYFSYDAGGKVEGKDRLLDEVGTGAIWLFGIPCYKKLIDKLIIKKAGLSPEVDVRVVKDNQYLQKAIKHAQSEKIVNELKTAQKNLPKFKGLTLLKFVLSLGLTMASYFALTKFKHNMTKKNIEKEFLENQVLTDSGKNKYNNLLSMKSDVFKEFNTSNTKKNPAFGSSALVKAAENFMFNPVKNMLLLDLGISSERLSNARTKGEFEEYSIKEGSFLFFVYGAGKCISKGINKLAKLLKHPIDLDAKILSSSDAKNILKSETLQKEVKDFASKLTSDDIKIYDYIFNNPENIVVKSAKKSEIIATIKNSEGKEIIDTRKYIDTKKIKQLTKDLETFINESKNHTNKTKYLNTIKSFKVASTLLNVAICCLALGYIVPKLMYKLRAKNQDGNNEFHVKAEYEKELKEKQDKGALNKV